MSSAMSVACSICICNYDEGDEDEFCSLKCGHAYHRSCLLEWKNSSKKMECPECRRKYTARTLTKLFLNIVPKDGDVQYLELQREQLKSANLQRDHNQALSELIKSRAEFLNLTQKQTRIKDEFAVKCQAYDLISLVNDEYLKVNTLLERENEKLKKEITELKSQQLKASKPFVDLTCDDDSDVEIIDDEKKHVVESIKPSEVIEVLDDAIESEVVINEPQQQPQAPEIYSIFDLDLKNPYAIESRQALQDFENFILEQM